jgi:signal transduction histidine kinase
VHEVDSAVDAPAAIAFGVQESFVSWSRDAVVGRVHQVDDVSHALRVLREEVIDLCLVHLAELTVEPAQLFPLLQSAAPQVPIIAVAASRVDLEHELELLRVGVSRCLALSLAAHSARSMLAKMRDYRSRVAQLDQRVRELASRIHVERQWREETTRVIDELLHDLRTPVGVLQGFGANLEDGIYGPLSEEQRHGVQRIQAAGSILLDLLGNVRERLPSPLPEQPIDIDSRGRGRRQIYLAEVLGQVVEMLEPQAKKQRVSLAMHASECPAVWAERTRISQLAVNLLSNALRFTPEGGRVTVRLTNEADASRSDRRVCKISVKDTGSGIPVPDIERVFTAGFTTGRKQGHAGMGLAICRQVIEEHGGRLEVSSTEGIGTTFTATLPVDPRSRPRDLTLMLLEDFSLVGQLVIELGRRGARLLHSSQDEEEQRQGIEDVARQLIGRGGTVVLGGALPERMRALIAGTTIRRTGPHRIAQSAAETSKDLSAHAEDLHSHATQASDLDADMQGEGEPPKSGA